MSSSGKLLTTAFRHGAVFAKATRSGTLPQPPSEAMAQAGVLTAASPCHYRSAIPKPLGRNSEQYGDEDGVTDA